MTLDANTLSGIDIAIFAFYFAALIAVGLYASRRRGATKDYFLAGRTLPWYAIGASMIAANIGGEQIIGMVGQSYTHGLVIANWSWLALFAYSLLIFVFLPYYLKCGFYTMPEFLERRYGPTSRLIFAFVTIAIDVLGFLGPTLYVGALALGNFFDLDPYLAIFGLALVAGSYSIYGGLLSVAWTDVLQCGIIYLGGVLLGIKSVMAAGGLSSMMAANPHQYHLVQGASEPVPFLGLLLLLPSVSIWYNCTNQFILQRCLAARTEWDSRMGVVFAGFLQLLMPVFVVLPGLAAAAIFQPGELKRPDDAYISLVRLLIPAGLRGLVIAALVSALVSTISSLVNSTSTIVTIDFYQRFVTRGNATNLQIVRIGRLSGVAVLLLGVLMACWLVGYPGHIFAFIQSMFAHIAPSFATVFLLGVFWRRPSGGPAVLTIIVGLLASLIAQYLIIPHIIYADQPSVPEFVFLYRLGAVWALCVVTLVAASFLWPTRAETMTDFDGWSPEYLRLPQKELVLHAGWKDFRLWWGLFAIITLSLLVYFR